MSLAEEMLATMPLSEDSATYSAEEEPHIIIDKSRTAFVPSLLKMIAVTGDNKVEKITFDCVRFWDGNDLSTFAIYLNYVLPDFSTGTYIPSSIVADDNFFHFDWDIKNNITKKSGKISFAITAIKTKKNDLGETVVDKQWSSIPNTDCSIALGLDISNVPSEEEGSGVLAQMSAILGQIQEDFDEWLKNNLLISQTTGESETAVMSQKAVTKEINSICETLVEVGLVNDIQNMLNPESVIDGFILENDTISTEGAYILYETTTRIQVEPNTEYVLRYEGEIKNRLAWMEFGVDLKPVGRYFNVDEVNRIILTTGENTHYVQLSFNKAHNVMFALSKYADMFYPFGGVKINLLDMHNKLNTDSNSGNILKGKKYCACGDSFTVMGYTGNEGIPEEEYIYQDGKYAGWGITYPFIIGLRNDMEVTNLAVGGMTMAAHDDSTNVFSLTRYKQIPADADYITIKLGINDDNYQTPVGTIDDNDNTTFYGAYNLVLDYILKNHPFAKVGIIVTNGSAKKYTDATIAIAKKWGIPYLDEVNDPNVPLLHRADREGVSDEVKNIRLANFRVNETNTHPNTKAHYYEATFVEDFLRRL